jgi:hypothetical protein
MTQAVRGPVLVIAIGTAWLATLVAAMNVGRAGCPQSFCARSVSAPGPTRGERAGGTPALRKLDIPGVTNASRAQCRAPGDCTSPRRPRAEPTERGIR